MSVLKSPGTADSADPSAPVATASGLLAASTATDLLRTALLTKLAVDLEDPSLARRAARYATSSARLLAGLDFPPHTDHPDDEDQALPEVDDLLERLPSRRPRGDRMTHIEISRAPRGKGLRGRAARERKQQLGALTKRQAQAQHDLPASGRRAEA